MSILWLNQFSIVVVNTLLVLIVMANRDFCGRLFETHVDHTLVGHDMSKAVVVDEFKCLQKCIANRKCKSLNIHPGGNKSEFICELNSKARQMMPDAFQRKQGSTYYGDVKEKITMHFVNPTQVSCIDGLNDQNKESAECHPGYKGERCQTLRRGWFRHRPGHSCKDIRESGDSKGDGEYWIDPENNTNPLLVYCDMTNDGGGWLLIYNIVIDGSSPPSNLGIETSYRGINHYNNSNMVLSTSALKELRTHLPFTQLRFHCNKQLVRTFHVTTVTNSAGEAVVQFFSRQTDAMPFSCGSFATLSGDNSLLAGDCANWGKDNGTYNVGKWGHEGERELYKYPAFVGFKYHWATNPAWDRWDCDDGDHLGRYVSIGDFWKIYVR